MFKINKKVAVFTIVKNEHIFLPIWLDYYKKYFNDKDIYVLDHCSDDGSTENLGNVNKIYLDYQNAWDHVWMNNIVNNFAKKLLTNYKYILFTEADEIVVPNPLIFKNLRDYINKCSHTAVGTNTYFVVHNPEVEPSLVLSKKPLLSQRNFWLPSPSFGKCLYTSIPVKWDIGFHKCFKSFVRDEDLILLHLHHMDINIEFQRSVARIKNQNVMDDQLGGHNRVIDYEILLNNLININKNILIMPQEYKSII